MQSIAAFCDLFQEDELSHFFYYLLYKANLKLNNICYDVCFSISALIFSKNKNKNMLFGTVLAK